MENPSHHSAATFAVGLSARREGLVRRLDFAAERSRETGISLKSAMPNGIVSVRS
ncbi:hypothetical protein [Streptomyces sp. NPDC002573]|uniref:hypothetical protein n=1 Tax=Streptomyces sp. NPDC002573 TaxID=3364651 RepID=UPI00368D031B